MNQTSQSSQLIISNSGMPSHLAFRNALLKPIGQVLEEGVQSSPEWMAIDVSDMKSLGQLWEKVRPESRNKP